MIRASTSERRQQTIMSTWQQHALSNATINHQNQLINHHNINHRTNSVETTQSLGDINHTSSLSEDFGRLFNQSEYSDIELIVESDHFYAHRTILAARSEYFRALLYGGLRESQCDNRTVEINGCRSAAFELLLKYIYTGRINLLEEKEEILLDLLSLVHQYGFQQLEKSLSAYFQSILSIKNVCTIYDTACLFNLKNLKQHSAQFIDNHANEIIKTTEFLSISPVSFTSFLFS